MSTTSTRQASHQEIKQQLDEKKRKREQAAQRNAVRTSPFQIKSAQIDLVKFPPASDTKQCPRKVMIRETFETNKAGEVRFKLHRSQKTGEPFTHHVMAQQVGDKWKAVHERVITVKKSIDRAFMAETINQGTKVRATGWEKLIIRCDQGHASSAELESGN